MSVVYDGPLPPGKTATKRGRAPAAAPPSEAAPALIDASQSFSDSYDWPLPSGKSASSRTAPAAQQQAAPRRPLPRPTTTQPQRAAANGRAVAVDGPASAGGDAKKLPALQQAFSDRLPGQRRAAPAAGRDIFEHTEEPAGPALTTFIPSLNAYVKAKIGKTGEVRYCMLCIGLEISPDEIRAVGY